MLRRCDIVGVFYYGEDRELINIFVEIGKKRINTVKSCYFDKNVGGFVLSLKIFIIFAPDEPNSIIL